MNPLLRLTALRHARALLLIAMLALALAPGCTRRAEPPAHDASAEIAARAQALIETGNVAFAAGDYNLAAKRYAAAVVEKPGDPAAYFGMGMALAKLGRDEEARAAYAKARELAAQQHAAQPEAPVPAPSPTPAPAPVTR